MPKTVADFVAEARKVIEEITPETLEDRMRSHDDLVIVDVREADEYEEGHIPNAILAPRGRLEGMADPSYKKPHPILSNARNDIVVLYCATGGRSAMATATLQEMGFERIYNLAGGIEMWEAEDYPTEAV